MNMSDIGFYRAPLPPEPGPSLEDQIEWKFEQIQNDAFYIDQTFQGDAKLTKRLANVIAARREGRQVAATDILAALDDWLDSELLITAQQLVKDEQ